MVHTGTRQYLGNYRCFVEEGLPQLFKEKFLIFFNKKKIIARLSIKAVALKEVI